MRYDHKAPRKVRSESAVSNDQVLLNVLLDTTPEQAEQWVMTNVTDLQSAKQTLAKLVKVAVFLLQKEFD